MLAIASSSRVTLGQVASTVARRRFTSSSRAAERWVTVAIANHKASFSLPSLSSIIESIFPAQRESQAALAGTPADLAEAAESSCESESALHWDGFLNAVPKSKVSHSRKAMRSANKGLKDRVDFVHCQGCGKPKLAHHICASCFSVINRAQKAAKQGQVPVQAKAGEAVADPTS